MRTQDQIFTEIAEWGRWFYEGVEHEEYWGAIKALYRELCGEREGDSENV